MLSPARYSLLTTVAKVDGRRIVAELSITFTGVSVGVNADSVEVESSPICNGAALGIGVGDTVTAADSVAVGSAQSTIGTVGVGTISFGLAESVAVDRGIAEDEEDSDICWADTGEIFNSETDIRHRTLIYFFQRDSLNGFVIICMTKILLYTAV